jgi:hypothetical protein
LQACLVLLLTFSHVPCVWSSLDKNFPLKSITIYQRLLDVACIKLYKIIII